MAVKLRLRRMGSKKHPFYRIVATDSRYQRNGRFLESLGHYDPMENPYKLEVDRDKVIEWLNKGAQMSDTVEGLLRSKGIVQDFNLSKLTTKVVVGPDAKSQDEKSDAEEEKTDLED